MLASLLVTALLGAAPCHLSLIAPAAQPARLLQQGGAPAVLAQDPCAEAGAPFQDPGSTFGKRAAGMLGGVLGSAVGALAGGLIGAAVAEDCPEMCILGPPEIWNGAFVGLLLGAGLGAHLTGNLMGGRGKWWGTALGTVGGLLVGLLTFSVIASADGDSDATAWLAAGTLLMPAAGAVTGYALSEPGLPGPCTAPDRLSTPRAPMLRMRFAF